MLQLLKMYKYGCLYILVELKRDLCQKVWHPPYLSETFLSFIHVIEYKEQVMN